MIPKLWAITRLLSGCQLDLPSPEGFSRSGILCKVVHSYGYQAGGGCWWETSVSPYVGLSTGFLSVLLTWQLDSLTAKNPREKENQEEAIHSLTQLHSFLEKQVPKSGEWDSTFWRAEGQRIVRHVWKTSHGGFYYSNIALLGFESQLVTWSSFPNSSKPQVPSI